MLSVVYADTIDLTGLSFEQLIELKSQINLAIWNSKEWQEVTVPQGLWKVGEDIPAGSWTVRCAAVTCAFVTCGSELKESGNGIEYGCKRYKHGIIDHPDYIGYEKDIDLTEFSFTVEEGDYIIIENCSVIFTPYAGAPEFGFR